MLHACMPRARRVCTRLRGGDSVLGALTPAMLLALGFLVFPALALPAAAQNKTVTSPNPPKPALPAPVAAPSEALEPLIVEGTKEAPEAVRLDKVAPNVTIDREEFTLLPSDRASDIVGRMPGVVISGPPGEKKSFSLRGLTPDFNRVEVDGVRPPTSGQTRSFELMNVPGEQLQTVEIKRTPTARDEADGIAGVISIETRAVPETPTLEVTGAVGGENEIDASNYRTSVFAGQQFTDNFGASGAFNYDQRTITKVKDKSERTFSGGPGGQGFLRDEVEPKDFTNIDGFLVGEFSYDDGAFRLRPSFYLEETSLDKWRDQYRRVTGQFNDRTLTDSTEDTTTLSLSAENEHRIGDILLESQFVIARTDFSSEAEETALNAALAFNSGSREESDIDDTLYQFGQDLTIPTTWGSTGHEIGLGYLGKYSERTSDREVYTLDAAGNASQSAANLLTSQESDYEIKEYYIAGYVMDEITYGPVTAAPGVRFEYVEDDMTGGLGTANPTHFDVLPSLPVTWLITEELAFQGGVARTVNRPKFDEMAPGITRRGPRSFNGNPDLEPARAWGYDAGLSWTQSDLYLGFNLFYRDITDVIESSETSTNVYDFRNVGDGWARGVELEQRFGIGGLLGIEALGPLTLSTNQTFVETEVDDPMTGKRPFADQAEFFANIELAWDDPDLGTRIAFIANYVGDRTTISYEGSGAVRDKTRQSEWTLDVRAEQQIVEGWSVFFTGENLTDEKRDEIEYLDGVLNRTAQIGSGRTFYVGTSLKF
jgi:outer membrane receptor protein involved in Fe transport